MKNSKFSIFQILTLSLFLFGIMACNSQSSKSDHYDHGMAKKSSDIRTNQNTEHRADSTFMAKANGINLEEIKLGKLAKEKSSTDAITELADMLITDHNELKKKLDNIADNKSMRLSANLSEDAKETYEDLNNLSVSDFDKEYLNKMVQGHQHAIALFEKDSATINDPALHQYIIETLPILQKHHDKAAKNQNEMNGPH